MGRSRQLRRTSIVQQPTCSPLTVGDIIPYESGYIDLLGEIRVFSLEYLPVNVKPVRMVPDIGLSSI